MDKLARAIIGDYKGSRRWKMPSSPETLIKDRDAEIARLREENKALHDQLNRLATLKMKSRFGGDFDHGRPFI